MIKKQKIPYKISEYITDHFKEDFLFTVKETKEIRGHLYYTIEVSKDEYIHTLRFKEDGTILKEEAGQAFPPDMHEEPTSRDMPE